MSRADNLYQDFLKKDQIAKLTGTISALEQQLTSMNFLLVRLVELLSEPQTTPTFASVDTATLKSLTTLKRPEKGDWL